MARNIYFSDKVRSEQLLYENIVIESLKTYGQDVYYLPRTLVAEDRILGEDVPSQFDTAYKIEMYLENTEGFDGEGDLFTKFGVEIRDEATFVVSRRRWNNTVSAVNNQISGERPREGDLVYLPLSNSLFEITHVEHEQPFYQLANLHTFKLRAHLFEYTGEDLDTGVLTIDGIEQTDAYTFQLGLQSVSGDFTIGNTVNQLLPSGTTVSGEVSAWNSSSNTLSLIHVGNNDSDGGFHIPVTGVSITEVGTGVTATISTIAELLLQSENEQNTDFGVEFLDFSESNPFGDPK
tara:strand:+ start:1041 stop:1916 length:876 start_codon:yes stop_codon:yes gene_type:complete